MNARIEGLRRALDRFVDQDRYATLVLATSDVGLGIAHEFLRAMDHESESELFFALQEDFLDARSYLDAAVARIASQVEAVNPLRRERGLPLLLPVPPALHAPGSDGASRFRALCDYAARFVDWALRQRIVWLLMPPRIVDRPGWSALVGPLLVLGATAEPWMAAHRFIVRDDVAAPMLVPLLEEKRAAGVLVHDFDASPERTLDDLAHTAMDAAAPVAERMRALFQLAAADIAHRRFELAEQKYALLHQHYVDAGDARMQALSLAGAGDVAMQTKRFVDARDRYHKGLAVAAPLGELPFVFRLLVGAGDAYMALAEPATACGHFARARDVTRKTLSVPDRITALRKLGAAERAAERLDDAVASWEAARGLCRKFELHDALRGVLVELVAAYAQLRASSERSAREQELLALPPGAASHAEGSPP